jgi:crotonobetainyl-CoA:carnitine CoA-transferase CaiB-like acyl-CoA transferase
MRPLEGIRVLDLTWVYSGPYCTLTLKDLGAEVIKLESAWGDYARSFPPLKNNWSGYFYMLNRGKKSITLDLKSDEGKELFFNLIRQVDVVTENFVPGTMDRLGIGYLEVREVNPKIIYASISGFGCTGPYAEQPSVDPVAQAMGGLMSMTGYPGQAPLKTGPAIADAMAGMNLTIAILASLYMREKTGQGQRVEVAMMDTIFAVLEEAVIRTSMTGNPLGARGNTDPLGAPWDAFATADGKWIMVCGVGGDKFHQIYSEIGRSDIAEKYKGESETEIERRSEDLSFLNSLFAEWCKTKTVAEVTELCSRVRIPTGIVNTVSDLLEDPQIKAREMIIDVDHPKLGAVKTFNCPIKFFGAEVGVKEGEAPADPILGEHNDEIFGTLLGLSADRIAELKNKKVI